MDTTIQEKEEIFVNLTYDARFKAIFTDEPMSAFFYFVLSFEVNVKRLKNRHFIVFYLRMKNRITESQLKRIVKESITKALKENLQNDMYSVFYKDGNEANDNYLSESQALSLAMSLENYGYEVIVARLLPNDEWETIYETR